MITENMDLDRRAFVDELTKLSASFVEGSTLGNPREVRKVWYRLILDRLGSLSHGAEMRNYLSRKRRKNK